MSPAHDLSDHAWVCQFDMGVACGKIAHAIMYHKNVIAG